MIQVKEHKLINKTNRENMHFGFLLQNQVNFMDEQVDTLLKQ